ncbi:MAG: hypothetical protein KA165_14180 [Saprospiraceae bacterium]|nr:hypothetical protein [Saprospiraceae bacterium]
MNDKIFDKRLKATLDNLEVPFDPSSWASLEQRLNAPFAEEHPAPVDAVDKAVFRRLDQLDAPYQPAHWDMLANRMTDAVRLKRRLWITKLSEVAIFLLLLANLDGVFHGTSKQTPAAPQTPASKRLQAAAPGGRSGHHGRTDAGHSGVEIAMASAGDHSGMAGAYDENGYPASPETSGIFTPEELLLLQTGTSDGSPAAIVLLNPTETPTPEHWESLPAIVKLPILLGNPLEASGSRAFSAPVAQIISPKQHRFYAATFAAYDWNHVQSGDYSTRSNGSGGGIAVGYRAGKWGIEAGLAYNRKQYQPKREEEIYKGNTQNGFYGSYAKSVDADMVSVPVKVTRRVARFGSFTAHATAGVTTHIALDKSYQYGSTFYPGQAPPDPNYAPGQQPQLRKKGQGVLENGSFNGNIYASADAGVRLEHPVGRHFVAFVEPVYRHSLGGKGIGPKTAKINAFSVQAGVLATL